MHTRAIVLSVTLIAWVLSPSSQAAQPRGNPACLDLDDRKIDKCLEQEATASSGKLVDALKTVNAVADEVCSAVPGPAIGACLGRAQAAADQNLQRELKAALMYIDSESASPLEAASWKKEFETSQNAWMVFKSADCSRLIDLEFMHGTGAGAAEMGCQLKKTLTRVEDLRTRYLDR